jgi:NADPH-dependent F420 reductase
VAPKAPEPGFAGREPKAVRGVRVAILGGTGKFGRALATRLAAAGDDVVIGSRDAGRARDIAAELGVRGARNDEVGDVELVVLAVEAAAALSTVEGLPLTAPLLSVAAEVAFAGGAARPGGGGRSLAERVAEIVDVPVAAGLHTIAAMKLAASPPDQDAFVCGDAGEAKRLALDLAAKVVAGRALDAGPLENARALEALTAVLLNLNRAYKTHAGLRVTGLS